MTQEPSDVSAPRSSGMPMLGLGTWQNTDPEQCARSVKTALEMGYRHIDTAQGYNNESYVGEGIARADVDRGEVFLATKVSTSNLAYDDVLESTEESLDRLGVDTIDLLYVHWPAGAYEAEDTLPAFDRLKEEGKIDRIGVSNFEPRHLDRAREILDAPIFANQVEMHPLLQQEELQEYSERHDVELVAYSPLARGEIFDVPVIEAAAEKYGVSEAQVSLAWLREKGVTAIPKATGEEHIRDNWESLTLDLDEEDVEKIDNIVETKRTIDPGFAPW